MNESNQSANSISYLQKKIVEVSREYYQAIKNNTSFENIKVIFLKRKKLKEEILNIQRNNNPHGKNFEEENVSHSLSYHD